MEQSDLEELAGVVWPLLHTLEALGFIARYLNPPDFEAIMEAAGEPEAALRAARPKLDAWPAALADLQPWLAQTADAALSAYGGLRAAQEEPQGMLEIYRALRHYPRALEALYPLAAVMPPVSTYFLDPSARENLVLQQSLQEARPAENTGVLHFGAEPGARGGCSIYVPEYYTPDRLWPLVMALHGGGGHGRSFLWNWLPAARSFGAVVIAPTSQRDTWAFTDPGPDVALMAHTLAEARRRWNIDPARVLLTGISDGGTFSYVAGLEADAPYTHLAPVAAAFHPMLAEMAEPARAAGLPIYLVHGALDWMFSVDMARAARQALMNAGAAVTYRELDNLSHCYPQEENAAILRWLRAS
ncbi:MAG: phospholipase [Hyphomonadaceae bacterium]